VARIAGVNIPTAKRVVIALTYIHGIGDTKAKEICEKVGIMPERRVNELSDAEVIKIRETIDGDYTVEGDLRREISSVCLIWVFIAVFVIVAICPFAVSAHILTHVHARVLRNLLPVRKSRGTVLWLLIKPESAAESEKTSLPVWRMSILPLIIP
jgi:hypothetical protein